MDKKPWRFEVIQKMNVAKAKVIYDELDRNKCFKAVVPNKEDRSLMNICFVMPKVTKLLKQISCSAKQRNLIGLKGHRSVGGFRASTYNALPIESVRHWLIMKEFEANH